MQCEIKDGGDRGNRLIVSTAKTMWAKSGIRSYYNGLTLGLVGIFPYAALDLGMFEAMKRTYIKVTTRNPFSDISRQRQDA